MRPYILVFGGLLALPCPTFAQTAPAPTIIACEGPNMPALCPRTSDAPRSLTSERSMDAQRRDVMALQAQQMIAQRQALARGLTPTPPRPAAPPVYPSFQTNPYVAPIAPPDFKSAVQVLSNVVNGGPHN
jgi:hypothetical protein